MITIVMVPMAILIGITASVFSDMLAFHTQVQQVTNIVQYSLELGSLLNNLQDERDLSALYVSSTGMQDTKTYLINQYPYTDEAIVKLPHWKADAKLIRLKSEFESKQKFLNFINQHRYEIDIKNMTLAEELAFYSKFIHVLQDWLLDSIVDIGAGSIWRLLVAYIEIIYAKDSFGLERAMGTTFFVQGGFPGECLNYFKQVITHI